MLDVKNLELLQLWVICHSRQKSKFVYLPAAIALLATIGHLYRALVSIAFVLTKVLI